jgi:hypothetical protein
MDSWRAALPMRKITLRYVRVIRWTGSLTVDIVQVLLQKVDNHENSQGWIFCPA